MDEILAQLEPTITLPCPDGFFAPFIYGESPLLYSLILGLTVLNLMSIALFRYRYTMRSANKELPWMTLFRKVKRPVMKFLRAVFSNELKLQISEGDLRSMKKHIRFTVAFSIILLAGIVISVGEIDRHAATIKECYASATDKLAGMGTSSPSSVFELPEWFNPAMVVPGILCFLLLIIGSVATIKNPAWGGKMFLLLGAICCFICLPFYLYACDLLFGVALNTPDHSTQVYASCIDDTREMYSWSGIGCLITCIGCLGAFVSGLRASSFIVSSNKIVPGEEAGHKPGDPEASRKTPQDLGDWYYALAAKQLGPVTAVKLYELRSSGSMTDNALVWCSRLAQWTAYKDARLLHSSEIAAEMAKCRDLVIDPWTFKSVYRPKHKSRNTKKAIKRNEARFTDLLMKNNGAQLDAPQLGLLYLEIHGEPTKAVLSAYPDLFPQEVSTFERIPLMVTLTARIEKGRKTLDEARRSRSPRTRYAAPLPEMILRDVPEAPPSPPEDDGASPVRPFFPAQGSDLTLTGYEAAPPKTDQAYRAKEYTAAEVAAVIKIQAGARRMLDPGAGKITSFAALATAVVRQKTLSERIAMSDAAQLWRKGDYVTLGAHVAYQGLTNAGNVEVVAEVETRDRHSLVSLTHPNEVDEEDERHLRDEQVSQIFFNCLVTELFVAATFNDTSTTTPPICVMNMTHPRWAHLLLNDTNATNATEDSMVGRMLGVKVAGEAAAVDMTGMLCSGGGNLMVLTMIVTGMSEAVMLIITAVICRVMFRFGNKPIEEGQRIFKLLWIKDLGTVKPKPWTRMQERGYHWRYAVGWMGNFIFFSVGLWYMSAIALCYGRAATDTMLEGWLTSTCISWFIMEPGFILLIVALPCLCKNHYVDTCNTRLNDIGCDISMFLG